MEKFDFVAIDFETANSDRDSACQIGITTVLNGEIKDVKCWLINPETHFDYFNILIHGITEDRVKNSPTFKELWPEIETYFKNLVFAHNATFDMTVLWAMLNKYNIEIPFFLFGCTIAMSRRTWLNEPSYSLQNLCTKFNIHYGNHDAGEDSKSCANLALKILSEKKINLYEKRNSDELLEVENILNINFGYVCLEGYVPSRVNRIYTSKKELIKQIIPDTTKRNENSIFFQKNIVFTGTLSSMVRRDAQQIIANIGGINQPGVTLQTDFLIVGQQDYRVVGEDGMSSKQEKAMKLKEKGSLIEIISEKEFIEFL